MFEKSTTLESQVEVIDDNSEILFVKKGTTSNIINPTKSETSNYFKSSFNPEDHGYILMNTESN